MFSWFPNHFKHSQNHLSKTKHASPLPVTEPARSSTWGKTKENTGWWWSYQEPIPKHALTLLPSPEPLILLPGPVPGGKQRKTLGWWWSYQEPIPKHPLTLLPSPVALPRNYSQTLSHTDAISRASHPAARSNTLEKTKENTVLVVALPRTYSQTLSCTAANSRAFHPAARSNTWCKTKENTVLVVALPRTYSLASCKHPLTLLPTPIAGGEPKRVRLSTTI